MSTLGITKEDNIDSHYYLYHWAITNKNIGNEQLGHNNGRDINSNAKCTFVRWSEYPENIYE